VESFLDKPVDIRINAREGIDRITDMLSGAVIEKTLADKSARPFGYGFRADDKNNVFTLTIPPHSYRVFKK
jgi:hypothetical protein